MPPSLTSLLKIGRASDGDQTKWPGDESTLHEINAEGVQTYLQALGRLWMNDRNEAEAGHTYILERFPNGYKLYGRTRDNDKKHVDKYLYGHPSGYAFRSVPEFYDHFKNIMKHGNPRNCTCKGCTRPISRSSIGGSASKANAKRPLTASSDVSTKRTSSSKSSSSASVIMPKPATKAAKKAAPAPPSSPPRQALQSPPPFSPPKEDVSELVDEEGTVDIWRTLALKLKEEGAISTAVEESNSIDWCLENHMLPNHIRKLQKQPLWMPRTGEIVLFIRRINPDQMLSWDNEDQIFKLWNKDSKLPIGLPTWEAGVISESSHEHATIEDLVLENGKEFDVSYSGFRVEGMPEIGNDSKPWSKRSAYIPLHQVRPFVFWKQFLKGTDKQNYHPTIRHAIGAAASFSLMYKFHFKGVYPDATIFCKGIYIGPELLLVGDLVRLTPSMSGSAPQITDVLKITAIKLKLLNIGSQESLLGAGDANPPPWYTCVHVSGVAYTTDPNKACGAGKIPLSAQNGDLPKGLDGYGQWYPCHEGDKRLEIPFQRILGRCYEDEAMMLWLVSKVNSKTAIAPFSALNSNKGKGKAPMQEKEVDLSGGLDGMMEARKHAAAHDPRIVRAEGKSWYFGNNRVEQLDLDEVKNVDVGSRSHFSGVEVDSQPRQAEHLEAMRKAKVAREKGHRGPGRPRLSRDNEGGLGGLSQKLANSGLVAGGLNMLQSDDEEEEEYEENEDLVVDTRKRNSEEMDFEYDNVATGELVGKYTASNKGGLSAKKQRKVIELD